MTDTPSTTANPIIEQTTTAAQEIKARYENTNLPIIVKEDTAQFYVETDENTGTEITIKAGDVIETQVTTPDGNKKSRCKIIVGTAFSGDIIILFDLDERRYTYTEHIDISHDINEDNTTTVYRDPLNIV